jgi:hypothetical protein
MPKTVSEFAGLSGEDSASTIPATLLGRAGEVIEWISSWQKADDDVATKLRGLCLCKVEMSLGGIAGSVSRRRGDHHIGAASASAGGPIAWFFPLSETTNAVLHQAGFLVRSPGTG